MANNVAALMTLDKETLVAEVLRLQGRLEQAQATQESLLAMCRHAQAQVQQAFERESCLRHENHHLHHFADEQRMRARKWKGQYYDVCQQLEGD